MIGANAGTGSGLVAGLRRGLIERPVRRFRAYAAPLDEAQPGHAIGTRGLGSESKGAGHEPADLGPHSRDPGSTPLRGIRLT